MINDQQLQHDVMAELEWEPSLDAANIGVAAHNGIVTLTGHVARYTDKLTAERVVARVKGVKGIAQEIEIRLPNEKMTADDQIAERAVRILEWNTAIPSGTVKVKVERGWVTLSGEVDWGYQRNLAERAVEKLTGVVGVANMIMVKVQAKPEDVRSQIKAALKRNASLEASGITIQTEGNGRVVLGGKVKAWYEREIAEQAAWSAPGVTAVEDRITTG